MKRLSRVSSLLSGVVCCSLLILLPVSYHLSLVALDTVSSGPSSHASLAFTRRFHVGFQDGGVWFFSHDYPYMGSIMNIGGPDTHEVRSGWHTAEYDLGHISFLSEHGEVMDKKSFCTLPGIYFRHFLIHGEAASLWTLMFSLWYPISVMAILPAFWIWRRSRLRFRKQ